MTFHQFSVVFLHFEHQKGEFLNIRHGLCVIDPPGPPEAPTVSEIMSTSCLVQWQPPTSDGGSPVTGYQLERRLTSSPRWLRLTKEPITELQLKVTDLIGGNDYEFQVCAVNKVGEGPFSQPCPPFTAKDPYGESDKRNGL